MVTDEDGGSENPGASAALGGLMTPTHAHLCHEGSSQPSGARRVRGLGHSHSPLVPKLEQWTGFKPGARVAPDPALWATLPAVPGSPSPAPP